MPASIEDLQQRSQLIRDALGGPLGDLASLKSETDGTAETFAALGQESAATTLGQSASPRLEEAAQLVRQAQSLLEDYQGDCEQAKGGGS